MRRPETEVAPDPPRERKRPIAHPRTEALCVTKVEDGRRARAVAWREQAIAFSDDAPASWSERAARSSQAPPQKQSLR